MSEEIRTCEFVSPKHPDKICDQIADSILDAYLEQDPNSRVAIEVMGGHGIIDLSGEISSTAVIDLPKIIQTFVGDKFVINQRISLQSAEIGQGVDQGGAGDQGIMIGYACSETKSLMSLEYDLSRTLCQDVFKQYPYDGKVQVTISGKEILAVVVSFQNAPTDKLFSLVKSLIQSKEYFINPVGEWQTGGFDADSGLTGRKIVVDSYGPRVPVGGGSFSGKDCTKLDRSGAYVARKIAVDYLRQRQAEEVLVKLGYVIGRQQPVMARVIIDGIEEDIKGYDLQPSAIAELLHLRQPIYLPTSQWGHFGRGFGWD